MIDQRVWALIWWFCLMCVWMAWGNMLVEIPHLVDLWPLVGSWFQCWEFLLQDIGMSKSFESSYLSHQVICIQCSQSNCPLNKGGMVSSFGPKAYWRPRLYWWYNLSEQTDDQTRWQHSNSNRPVVWKMEKFGSDRIALLKSEEDKFKKRYIYFKDDSTSWIFIPRLACHECLKTSRLASSVHSAMCYWYQKINYNTIISPIFFSSASFSSPESLVHFVTPCRFTWSPRPCLGTRQLCAACTSRKQSHIYLVVPLDWFGVHKWKLFAAISNQKARWKGDHWKISQK